MQFRKESDSIGELNVPINAYYGVQTLRGFNNFQITGVKVNDNFVKNVVRVKKACAIANYNADEISKEIYDAIILACEDALNGKLDDAFITDAIQGGAGTTLNMNVNEVIANRATEILGGKMGEYICHPNDHVNKGQSTNDVIPTAGKLTIIEFTNSLIESLDNLIIELDKKAVEFDDIVKMGRTQLEDAVPIRLGQEFNAYASALKRCKKMIISATEYMYTINLGATAIGTAINAAPKYLNEGVEDLSKVVGYTLTQADDLIDSTQNLDAFAYVSGGLKSLAIALSKMSNDLRLSASGPRTGLMEINLPPMQNGSSIMPGKVNPVIPEVVSQVAFAVIGNDTTIAMACEGGQFELNAFEPVIFYKLFESLTALKNAMDTLTKNCIVGITANREVCQELLDHSVGIVTALCPIIGYKKSVVLAKKALKENIPIKKLVVDEGILTQEEVDKVFDAFALTQPKRNK
ncbi:MAG: aspartate ammonia-lyase [Clostridia bacterium]|nr:aspartate ammonia-lyase [Clostridia bacterium]